jgi:hypothetical protein
MYIIKNMPMTEAALTKIPQLGKKRRLLYGDAILCVMWQYFRDYQIPAKSLPKKSGIKDVLANMPGGGTDSLSYLSFAPYMKYCGGNIDKFIDESRNKQIAATELGTVMGTVNIAKNKQTAGDAIAADAVPSMPPTTPGKAPAVGMGAVSPGLTGPSPAKPNAWIDGLTPQKRKADDDKGSAEKKGRWT